MPPKASSEDFLGRFREIVSDPINLLIERVPDAGVVEGGLVQLHNGNRVPFSGQGASTRGSAISSSSIAVCTNRLRSLYSRRC